MERLHTARKLATGLLLTTSLFGCDNAAPTPTRLNKAEFCSQLDVITMRLEKASDPTDLSLEKAYSRAGGLVLWSEAVASNGISFTLGSGVLIQPESDNFSILTAKHVIDSFVRDNGNNGCIYIPGANETLRLDGDWESSYGHEQIMKMDLPLQDVEVIQKGIDSGYIKPFAEIGGHMNTDDEINLSDGEAGTVITTVKAGPSFFDDLGWLTMKEGSVLCEGSSGGAAYIPSELPILVGILERAQNTYQDEYGRGCSQSDVWVTSIDR